MQIEAVIVMIVGVLALVTVRLIVAVVGRDFAADHDQREMSAVDLPQAPRPQVRRGTGRNRHLIYFVEAVEPAVGEPLEHEVVRPWLKPVPKAS